MYQPTVQEKTSEQGQFGGVIVAFAKDRRAEAEERFREIVKSPLAWIQENQPVRKGLLLEGLELLRPGVDVAHEHRIEQWRKTKGVKKSTRK